MTTLSPDVSRIRVDTGTGYGPSPSPEWSEGEACRHLAQVMTRVDLGLHMARLAGLAVRGARVVNIGASTGAEAVCLAMRGASEVIGTDYGEAFTDPVQAARLEAVRGLLQRHAAQAFPEAQGESARGHDRLRFVHDNACGSSLLSGSADLIVSWQTLEHIPDIGAFFREHARLLRPGGVAVHEYNPFFALDGGHSLCTLDTPWGHVRSTDAQMLAHLRRIRPQHADEAIGFFRHSLNRLTHASLARHIEDAGLVMSMFVPRARTEDLLLLDDAAWHQASAVHPGLSVMDLVCRIVRVVVRRPE